MLFALLEWAPSHVLQVVFTCVRGHLQQAVLCRGLARPQHPLSFLFPRKAPVTVQVHRAGRLLPEQPGPCTSRLLSRLLPTEADPSVSSFRRQDQGSAGSPGAQMTWLFRPTQSSHPLPTPHPGGGRCWVWSDARPPNPGALPPGSSLTCQPAAR